MGLVERWYQLGTWVIEEKVARNHQIKGHAFKVKLYIQVWSLEERLGLII